MGNRRRIATALTAGALALAGIAGCGGEDETETVAPAPEGPTGASEAQPDTEKPAAEANREGAGAGLEQDISGSDTEGTDTEAGQQATTGDPTAE